MVRALTTAAALLFVAGGTALAGPTVQFSGTLSSGAKVQLYATGNLLAGNGLIGTGPSAYPLVVTSVTANATSVIFSGALKTASGVLPFMLVVNKANGSFALYVNGNAIATGQGTISTSP